MKRQVAPWKVKQEKVRFSEQSALKLEMDRLSLKRSEEDLERLRTELGLPVATGMKFLFSTPRMPAPSQTATEGHPPFRAIGFGQISPVQNWERLDNRQ